MKKLMMTMALLPLMAAVGFTLMASTINVSGGGDAYEYGSDFGQIFFCRR